MSPEDVLFRFRLRALSLAEELGSMRAACCYLGLHPSTFYRWRKQALRFGLEILRPRAPPAAHAERHHALRGAARGGLRAGPPGLRPRAHRR